jgi:sugar lactone lactonase YvrE
VFRKDGTYLKEAFIARRTFLNGAASGFALSADPQQRFLYMIDGANHHVWILNRETLQVLARFGQQGLFGGSLNVPHAIAVDSRGNIYVGENFDGRRFQRFLFKGVGTPKPGMNPPTTRVR